MHTEYSLIDSVVRLPELVAAAAAAGMPAVAMTCLLYTSDAADERSSVDLGGRRIIKKKKTNDEVGGRCVIAITKRMKASTT